jgi:hypothetical protein
MGVERIQSPAEVPRKEALRWLTVEIVGEGLLKTSRLFVAAARPGQLSSVF